MTPTEHNIYSLTRKYTSGQGGVIGNMQKALAEMAELTRLECAHAAALEQAEFYTLRASRR